MKKHELIKEAYDRYPKGTKFIGATKKQFTSNGIFKIWGEIGILNDPTGLVYDFETEKWAKIIPDSILTGKCAIQVNNEREFKLLMEHYEGKGWKVDPMNENAKYEHNVNYCCYDYHDRYRRGSLDVQVQEGYKIIPFKDFAAEVGIEVPVFVMTSEDGVPLYVGDNNVYAARLNEYNELKGIWTYDGIHGISKEHFLFTIPDKYKAFSTKEAAEAWIKEQNKPKEILLFEDEPVSVVVTKNGFEATAKVSHHAVYRFEASDLEQIYAAYKSLQS